MKTMAQKAAINNGRLRNHSGRRTMNQTLGENDIPPAHIAHLSGHKNLKRYRKLQQGLDKTTDANVQSS